MKVISIGQSVRCLESTKSAAHVMLGAVYVALLSQLEIPVKPVPVTMQTFAVLTLALAQGSKKAPLSLLLYLFAASIGMPVLAGWSIDPLWILSPSGGFLLSFPLAAYVVGRMKEIEGPRSSMWVALGLTLGQIVMFSFGLAWLSFLVGNEQALICGFYPFILLDTLKLGGAFSFAMAGKSAKILWKKFFLTSS